MRILFTVHGYKPAWRYGGPTVSVPALAEALVTRGHEVNVFTTNSNLDQILDVEPNRCHDVNGVKVWYFEKQEPLQSWFPRVAYLAKSMGVLYSPKMATALAAMLPHMDLVHTHLPFIYPTFAAAKAARRLRKPLFYHQRGVFDPERLKFRAFKKKLYMHAIEVPILRQATTLIALTENEKESYRRLAVSTPCRVIPNGVELPSYEEGPLPGEIFTAIKQDSIVVLFMGRIHPVKGADTLLDAFLRVAGQHPDAILVLAGPDEFGLEASFRVRAREAGIERRVLFPGMVEGELKRCLLQRADLFCLPSDAEGLSMAMLEALAARTAVLISPGCHFDVVQEAGAGRVVAADPEPIATALNDLLQDRERLKTMGEAGRRLVATHYTWDRIADQMIDAYNEGVARHGAYLSSTS